jgi:large subunit ribosomal protein L10
MPREDKVAVVDEISEKLAKSQVVIITDYRGLNVQQITDLRAKLREAGIEYKVVKNTLTKLAADKNSIEGLDVYLEGPSALAFGYDDPVVPAKILSEFAKTNPALEIKVGVLEGKVIGPEGVKQMADLPSKEVLLAQVVGGIQAPITGFVIVLAATIRGLVNALDAIRKQKEAA